MNRRGIATEVDRQEIGLTGQALQPQGLQRRHQPCDLVPAQLHRLLHKCLITQRRLGSRVVVKPTRCGSALGVTGVDGLGALPSALVTAYAYGEDALVERFGDGIDVSVVCVEDGDGLRALSPVHVDFEKGHEFDFAARYTAEYVGLSRPDLPEDLLAEIGRTACEAHRVLGLAQLSRSDFLVAPDGSYVVLETAITPGTTETSVMPFACTLDGTSLGQVTLDLIRHVLA